jgi:hypothetical protein
MNNYFFINQYGLFVIQTKSFIHNMVQNIIKQITFIKIHDDDINFNVRNVKKIIPINPWQF